jgi:hypothetical protein
MKPTICLDFDGVLNTYTGWRGEEELFQPAPGVAAFLGALAADYELVIHSTRDPVLIMRWLVQHGLNEFIRRVDAVKPKAIAYVDDRAIRHEGDFEHTLELIRQESAGGRLA